LSRRCCVTHLSFVRGYFASNSGRHSIFNSTLTWTETSGTLVTTCQLTGQVTSESLTVKDSQGGVSGVVALFRYNTIIDCVRSSEVWCYENDKSPARKPREQEKYSLRCIQCKITGRSKRNLWSTSVGGRQNRRLLLVTSHK
jgi:hypothetical protein